MLWTLTTQLWNVFFSASLTFSDDSHLMDPDG